ncbi:uncharacterized mitochondrial protein AtMg00810-like [Salvia splendens]|uniref:uncharacterized mitochondrial protein AtMg00810-like n=1 Tax=Salvia splendens TaxID=180675 RepID=UPI001C25454D|nr:uncharacterized mitochondrial protein AtMg00810-like [Salvia splendens]
MMLALAAIKGWSLTHLDINNAFHYGDLEEDIYMTLPTRVEVDWMAVEGATPDSTLSASDHSFFYKSDGAAGFFGIAVYVDDILVATTDPEMTNSFKDFLTQHFKFKGLGVPKYFLGLEIARNKKGIQVCQRKYTMDLLKDTGFLGCKPSSVPMGPVKKLQLDSGSLLEDASKYRRLIGRLLYMCITRPDITFVVHKLSQYVSKPCIEHWQAVERVLKYLKGTPGHGLFYSSSSKPTLSIFSDADWAACPDTRKSMTGYCLFHGNSMIS